MPEMIFVDSTNIQAIGYDVTSQQLHVQFVKTGRLYIYYPVEEAVFEEFLQSGSKGAFLNSRIKPHYQCSEG